MIKGVVFDLDNTVYDYDACHEKAVKKLSTFVCEKYGISMNEFEYNFNKAKTDVKNQLGDTGSSHNRMLYMQIFLENIGLRPTEGALDLYDIYWNELLANIKLFPYVVRLMNELKERGIKILILTDLTAHIQHRKIAKIGLSEYIDVFVSSEEAGEEKPSKRAFDRLLLKAKLNAEELLMIGDSQTKDIDGSKASGLKALLYKKENRDSMDEICMEYIDEINQLDSGKV